MAEHYDVFLSYAHADAEEVHRLAENLHNAGLEVFLDDWRIAPGDVLVHKLDDALLNSRNGILCVTPTALSRDWVLEEYAAMMTRAAERKLRLIPVLLADAPLPPLLASRVWVDLRTADGPEYERALRKLIATLKGETGPPPRILPRPDTAFRAEGTMRGRLRNEQSTANLQGNTFDIFLSYSSENRTWAEDLATKLKANGLRIWFDQWNIEPGQGWVQAIEDGIQRAKTFVACVGKTPSSKWAREELDRAVTRANEESGFIVIPVLMPGVQAESLKGFIRNRQAISFSSTDDPEALQKLVKFIRRILAKVDEPESTA